MPYHLPAVGVARVATAAATAITGEVFINFGYAEKATKFEKIFHIKLDVTK